MGPVLAEASQAVPLEGQLSESADDQTWPC